MKKFLTLILFFNLNVFSQDSEYYFNIANDHFDHHRYNRAIEYYTKAIEIDTNDFAAYDKYILGTYYNRGLAYQNLKKYDDAIRDYTKAIEIWPYYQDAYYNRGLAYQY